MGSEGEGTAGTMLEGRGKMPERGLRSLDSGGTEEGRVERWKPVLELECKASVGVIELDVAAGRSEERGTSVVCTTP